MGEIDVQRAGIEPATPSLEGWCSIQLSYRHPNLSGYHKYATTETCNKNPQPPA